LPVVRRQLESVETDTKKIPVNRWSELIDDPLLTSADVCAYLAIAPRTLKRYTAKKILSFIRLSGGAFRFRKSEIDAFLERRTVKAA